MQYVCYIIYIVSPETISLQVKGWNTNICEHENYCIWCGDGCLLNIKKKVAENMGFMFWNGEFEF